MKSLSSPEQVAEPQEVRAHRVLAAATGSTLGF
jgi:hypothetical protein